MHKYLYTHGDPVNGVDPTGMFLGSVVGFVGSIGANIGRVGLAVTVLSSVAGAGVYKFYFRGSAVRGGIVGAQIGASLSYAYALGSWKNVAKVAAKGFEAGVFKLIAKGISNWMSGTLNEWTAIQKQQDFIEGFAGGVWIATFAQYIENEGLDDELKGAMSTLLLSVSAAILLELPEVISGRKSGEEAFRGIVFNTIPAWFSGKSLDGALSEFAPTPLLLKGLKTVLMSTYIKGFNSFLAMFDDDYRA